MSIKKETTLKHAKAPWRADRATVETCRSCGITLSADYCGHGCTDCGRCTVPKGGTGHQTHPKCSC